MRMHAIELTSHWAWNTSLAALPLMSLVFLGTIFLRKPGFTPVRHMLGLLVVARLLLPFSPASSLSVLNLVGRQNNNLERVETFPLMGETALVSPAIEFNEPPAAPVRWPQQLAFIWAIGVLAVIGRVAIQHAKVRRWVRNSQPIEEGEVLDSFLEAKRISGCRREVGLNLVPEISSPALFGIFQPRILLPMNALDYSAENLRLIFLHEFAHVRRWDVLIKWLMIVARGLHWFNPLAWLATRRLEAEQELLCDGDVMRLVGSNDQRAYAETLLALASENSAAPAAVIPISSSYKQVKERIGMIRQFKPAHRLLLWALPPIAALIGVVTFTAAVNKKVVPSSENSSARANSPKRMVEVLREMLKEEDAEVERKSNEVAAYRSEIGIVGDPANGELVSTDHLDQIRSIRGQVAEMDGQMVKKQNEIRALKRSVTGTEDPGLNRLIEEQETIQRDVVRLIQDRSEDHPEVKTARTKLKLIEEQIQKRRTSKLENLEAAFDSDMQAKDQLRSRLNEEEAAYRQKVERSRPYFRAKRDLEILQAHRDKVYTRLLEEQVEVDLKERASR